MDILEQYRWYFLGFFLSCIILEIIWSLRKKNGVYNWKETLSNAIIFTGSNFSKAIFGGILVVSMNYLYQFRLFDIPDTLLFYLIAILFVDFLAYCQHRLMHVVPFFWAIHEVHHSSPWFNLTSGLRLNWMAPIFGPIFFAPAALLGFSTTQIITFFILNLFYQFWLHTQAIGKLGVVEGILNTPSAHRVHHGSKPLYIDKNFGGVLMIWDRIFGTYQQETEQVIFGVTTGFQGHNPLRAEFGPMIRLFKNKLTLEASPSKKKLPQLNPE